jgi:hypothetical protein
MRNHLVLILSAALSASLLVSCTTGPQKPSSSIVPTDQTLTLQEAMTAVHDAIVTLQKQQNHTGMMLSQAQVQLTLTAQKTGNAQAVIGVTLPITANATISDGLQATRGDQITLTFTNYLTLPNNSVGWLTYAGNTPTHVQQTESDVTGKDGTVTKTTTTDTTTPNRWRDSDFLKTLEDSGAVEELLTR